MKRLVLFLVWPDAIWRELRAHPQSPRRLFATIVVPFAVLIALAHQAGWTWFNVEWSSEWGYASEPIFGGASALVILLMVAAAPLLMGAALSWLAPWCGGPRDFAAGLGVSTFGTLPLFIASCGLFFMPMIVVCLFAFAYSCHLYVQGARVLLAVRRDEGFDLVIGALLASGAALSMLTLAVGLLVGGLTQVPEVSG